MGGPRRLDKRPSLVYLSVPLSPPPPPLHLATRPALAGAVALGVGIALSGWVRASVATWSVGALAAAAIALTYTVVARRRLVTLRPMALALAALALAVALGAVRMEVARHVPPDDVSHLARAAIEAGDRPVTMWATVAEPPERSWSVQFVAEADSVEIGGRRESLSGGVQVRLRDDEGRAVYPTLREGDRVRLTATLSALPDRRNPADMDYGAYLQRQGVGAVATVRDETGVAFLAPSRRLDIRLARAVRAHVRTALARHVPDAESRALLAALLLADRSGVEATTLDAFRATGLMHLLAVSGLHVGLVGLALYVLLKPALARLGFRRRTVERSRAAVTLAILTVYVLIAGAPTSVVRALVMVGVLIAGRAAERRADTLNGLGVAAIILLLHRPTALFDVGFQLSFGAVAALATLTPQITAAVPERVRQSKTGYFIVGSVATSLAATVGTAPALLAHFGRLPLGGLILNLPAIPLTGATLAAGLGCALTSWMPPVAKLFGALASVCGQILVGLTEAGAATLGWATYDGFLDSPSALTTCVLAIGAFVIWRRSVPRRRLLMAAVGSVAVGLWSGFASGADRPRLDVVFLDVGQGDATLLSTPDGSHVLIDAGIRSPYTDQGARVVVPHLRRYGVRRLDALVLTHADADHIGGARSVMEAVPVGRLVVNGQPGDTDLWADVIGAADSLGVPVEAVRAGDTLAVDPAVRIRVLGPDRAHESPNDASVALRVEHGATRWLLTGDAEAQGEAALVARFPRLDADVVKVGHHGSRTSSAPALVAATGRPAFAVVSVAARNRYGLPNEEPLARWAATGAEILSTATEGAVWLRSDGQRVTRVDWRE